MAEKRIFHQPDWFRLDNAGILFPGQNTSKWSNIFRVTFELKEDVDTDTYKCGEAVKDIEGYIESHFRRREVLSDPKIGEKFLFMAQNMDKLYTKEIMSTDLKVLHNHIVRKVYKIRSKDPDSKPLLMALRPYLEYVSDKYDVELLPPVEA